MEGYGFQGPGGTWAKDRSPGELAQRWASYATMGLKWYFQVTLTEKEREALATLIAKFLVETKKKSGVDLTKV